MEITQEDLTRRGVPRELVGRLRHVVSLHALGRDALLRILHSGEFSPVAEINAMLASTGHRIEFSDALLGKIADEAIQCGTGARGLRQKLLSRAGDLLFDAPSDARERVVRIEQ